MEGCLYGRLLKMRFRLLDYLSKLFFILGGIALVVLIAIINWSVWWRYLLNNPRTWTEQLALLLVLVVVLPISAIGLRENTHLNIEFITNKLPHKAQKVVDIINSIVLLFFGIAMILYSIPLVKITLSQKIPLLGVSQSWQYVPLMVTGALISIFMIEKLWFSIIATTQITRAKKSRWK